MTVGCGSSLSAASSPSRRGHRRSTDAVDTGAGPSDTLGGRCLARRRATSDRSRAATGSPVSRVVRTRGGPRASDLPTAHRRRRACRHVAAVGVRDLTSAGHAEQTTVQLSAAVATPSPVPAGATAATSAAPLVVYACGAVSHPGVYELPAGARVADVCSGWARRQGRPRLHQPGRSSHRRPAGRRCAQESGRSSGGGGAGGSAAAGGSGATASGAAAPRLAPVPPSQLPLLSLDTATLQQLDALQGAGPVTAQKIIDYRTANGGFKERRGAQERARHRRGALRCPQGVRDPGQRRRGRAGREGRAAPPTPPLLDGTACRCRRPRQPRRHE